MPVSVARQCFFGFLMETARVAAGGGPMTQSQKEQVRLPGCYPDVAWFLDGALRNPL